MNILPAVACIAMIVLVSISLRSDPSAWQVKDSKGRVRLALNESGDAVEFVMLAANGEKRFALKIGEDGSPSLRLMDGDERGGVLLTRRDDGGWSIAIAPDRGNAIVLGANEDVAGIAVSTSKGDNCIDIAASSEGQASIMLQQPGGVAHDGLYIWCGEGKAGGTAGLLIGNMAEQRFRAGIGVSKKTERLFIGTDGLRPDSHECGIIMESYQDKGPILMMAGRDDANLVLKNQAPSGLGIIMDIKEQGRVMLGGSSNSSFKLRMIDPEGKEQIVIPGK